MRSNGSLFQNIDWILVFLYFALALLGWLNIYAAVYNEEFSSIFDMSQKYGKQLLWIGTSVVIILVIMFADATLFQTLAFPIYIISILSLLGLFVFGKEIAGAQSWYAFGSFSLQPSEFAKFATALATAKYLSTKGVSMNSWKDRFVALIIVFLPAAIIIPQPDPGSALVYSAFFLVFYREGLSGNYIFAGFALVILFILSLLISPLYLFLFIAAIAGIFIFLYRRSRGAIVRIVALSLLAIGFIQSVDYTFNNVLEDRHRNRINILLGKAHDPKGIGYNTAQSMIAIGSGGLTGKGYLEGTQTKFDFVPEQSTDFIFCTVGEEWGFVGSSVVVILFILLFFRIIIVAERQKSAFSRIYGYSVASILFFHFAVNIAMTIGLAPVVGIPLPFFSYGGSSLWGFTLLLFIFIKLDSNRMEIL
ncbi:rod shape-determining protein RodA [Owenweeksia hongkongensis]|uniref:rod shape-determining protein RodA n=1 Tax=Owenweeksia hongkongensis TaxID=253245 RepID=UPI003A8F87C0